MGLDLSRRSFLRLAGTAAAVLAAPAIVRAADPIFVRRAAPLGTEFYTADLVDDITPSFMEEFARHVRHAFERRQRDGLLLSPVVEVERRFDIGRQATLIVHRARVIGYAA